MEALAKPPTVGDLANWDDHGSLLPAVGTLIHRHKETADTWTLEIEPRARADLKAFAPGQFAMITAFGVGEIPLSLSRSPAESRLLTTTVRAAGAVSTALTQLGIGRAVGFRGPFGVGWPMNAAEAHDVIIVAGGLGLAPLRPALYRLFANRDRYRRVTLLYGARTPAEILYRAEIERWRGRLDIDIDVTVDRAGTDWLGHVGVVTRLIDRADLEPENTVAMVCGPEVMMRFAVPALRDVGIAEDAIHLSLERNMQCGVGHCGHCQLGPILVCRDGPVVRYDRLRDVLSVREV